ncbi:hypothetical protein [Streptomyces sp. NPDC088725]|uniref:hypothetical protein n=1 Tax=Streptomyces sp. NPDC088725 TaxID=3365873 RepID=UPI00380D87F5
MSSDPVPGQIQLTNDEFRLNIMLGFSKGALSSIELFRFRNEDTDVRVVLDGLDVFRTPSAALFEQLAERGHTIEEDDMGFDGLPELNKRLANQSSYEYPTDEEGAPNAL